MSAARQSAADRLEAREARDVMAFGQDVGRVLSDGRILGRPEPFAKVFTSSRTVKRAVGATAWVILEDIALDATIDVEGRLVAETSARRIAQNLGLNKDTVTRYLRILREHSFVLHEEARADASGRFETCRYVLDPSACVERFTHSPAAPRRPAPPHLVAPPPQRNGKRGGTPCPTNPDMDTASDALGHGSAGPGDTGPGASGRTTDGVVHRGEQQQSTDIDGGNAAVALRAVGVSEVTATALVAEQPTERITDVLRAAEERKPRNPAGWVVAALRHGWDVTPALNDEHATRARRERAVAQEEARRRAALAERQTQERVLGWHRAISAALDDAQLAEVLHHLHAAQAHGSRWSAPVARALLLQWCVAAHRRVPTRPLADVLVEALADQGPGRSVGVATDEVPEPPAIEREAPELTDRIAAHLGREAGRGNLAMAEVCPWSS